MKPSDVEKFYNDYKTSLSTIDRLERQLLKESYSYEKWYDLLLLKSNTLRDIYAHNLDQYNKIILEAIKDPDSISDDVKGHFLTHIDFFLSENHKDYGVTAPVLRALLPYWAQKANPGKLLDCNFFLGVSLTNSHYYGEACQAFDAALSCFDDFIECPELYWTYRMMCAAYYRLLSYVCLERINQDVLYTYFKEALEIWTDERLSTRLISFKKQTAIKSILRSLVCHAVFHMLDSDELPNEDIVGVVVDEYYYQTTEIERTKMNCLSSVVYCKYLRATGKMSISDYRKNLSNLAITQSANFDVGYEYGSWEFISLFDDELSDEVFDQGKLFYMNPSFAYINYALVELLSITDSETVKLEACQAIYRYFMELPPIPEDGLIDTFLFPIITQFVTHCDDEDMLVDCILNLLVHRQMSTAIHVTMVALISKCIAHHLIDSNPEYFVGVLDLNTVEEVLSNREKIESFIYKAGILHDIGKLICSDVVNLQNRRISDEEFARIKVHPVAGSSLLLNSSAMFDYSFVALCHHLFDDGSRGYPAGVKLPEDASRIFIEIVTICDSIDAMSDTLGRNYATPKNMSTIIDELLAEAGTRYSSRVLDAINKSDSLREEIEKILYEDRINVHFNIYRNYVLPDVKFRPEDEKFISPIQEEHIELVSQALDLNPYTLAIMHDSCREYSYVITDNDANIYGVIMCEPIESQIMIRQIYVDSSSRRKGYGSLLLRHVEDIAHSENFSHMYIIEVTEGHYDKFAWHNGYSTVDSDVRGWMIKKL